MCRFSYDGEKFTHFLLSWQIFHADEVPWFIHCSSMFPVKRTTDLGEADSWGWWLVLVMRCSFGYLAPARGGTSTSRVMVTGQLPSSFSLCTEIIRWQQINFSRFMKELRSWSRFAEYLNYTPSAQTRAAATVRWNETYTFSSFHHSSLTCQILKYLHNYTEVDIVVCPVCSGVVQNISPEYSVCMRCLYGLWLVTVFTIMTGV